MHAGRFVVFFPRDASQPVQPKSHESGHEVSVGMLPVQFVSPNRVELIELIVQHVAAIFCHQNRVSVIYERDIVERSMVSVAKHNERYGSTVSVSVEINTKESAPGAARRQFRLHPSAIICIASDREDESPKT